MRTDLQLKHETSCRVHCAATKITALHEPELRSSVISRQAASSQNSGSKAYAFNGMFSKEYSIEEKSIECKESSESREDPSVSNFTQNQSLNEEKKKSNTKFIKRASLKSATNEIPKQNGGGSRDKQSQEGDYTFSVPMSKQFETAIPNQSNNPYWL